MVLVWYKLLQTERLELFRKFKNLFLALLENEAHENSNRKWYTLVFDRSFNQFDFKLWVAPRVFSEPIIIPQMPTEKDLDGIFSFMAGAYEGNRKFRWGETPYLRSEAASISENILSHQWGCATLWLLIRNSCPNLDAAVDAAKVYEMLLTHDLGELDRGDISLVLQLNGQGTNKSETERAHIADLGKKLPTRPRQRILNLFDEFEERTDKNTSLEGLLAVFIDGLQGNSFALVFGHDLPQHSDLISKIVNKYFVPSAKRLITALEKREQVGAVVEIKEIFRHHIKQMQGAGIAIETSGFEELMRE